MKRAPYIDPFDDRNTKRCRRCGEVKPITEFAIDKRYFTAEGRCYVCRRLRGGGGPDPRKWTPELIDTLARCIHAGCTAGEAATATGRSKTGVDLQRRKLGLPPFARRRVVKKNAQPQANIDRVRQLRQAGHSYSEVAAITGFSRNKVAGIIRDHIKPRQESPRHESALPHLRAAGCPAGTIRVPAVEHRQPAGA